MIHGEIDINQEAAWSLERLLPRLEEKLALEIEADPQMWQVFQARLKEHFASFQALSPPLRSALRFLLLPRGAAHQHG